MPLDALQRARLLRWIRPALVGGVLWAALTSVAMVSVPAVPGGAKVLPGKVSAAPEDSRWVQVREHEIDGLRVTEVVLGRTDVDAELPLLVQFHGRGSRPTIPTGDHTRTPPVRLMLPWAPDPLGDGYTWFPLSVTEGRDKVLGHHIERRVQQLAHVIKKFASLRPTEGRPLVAGFSQGGMLTFGLALLRPDLVEAAFPLAGWLPSYLVDRYLDPSRTYPPIRALHGSGDPVVPLVETRAMVRRLQASGLDATLEVFESDQHELPAAAWTRYKAHVREAIRLRRRGAPDLG